ncbi:DUF6461 domain-containing protein [Streptomyces sparsogenes]|uniref:Uncharacterized protein n=1 Tax=Streptomyces sparsogenes DSM 40356 TaxID=1331668 RepID=A0A1R1SAW5_9ACTN|nr:DUF6461 domain-containing protein [Streptomyces sparsogenes]OMI35347.1 hypothetical protein SPAR_31786 [Streptomyces sparsogenes DSM 40356]
MSHSLLFDALWDSYRDQYGLTCVRDTSESEVLARLGVTDGAPLPRLTVQEAMARFGLEMPAVRLCVSGRWNFLLDVDPHGKTFDPRAMSRLSVGTEVVSAWYMLAGTVRVAYAYDGRVLATYRDFMCKPAEGTDPGRLNRALDSVGFFSEEFEESDDWDPAEMALAAIEREFAMALAPEVVNGPLATVSLPETYPGD